MHVLDVSPPTLRNAHKVGQERHTEINCIRDTRNSATTEPPFLLKAHPYHAGFVSRSHCQGLPAKMAAPSMRELYATDIWTANAAPDEIPEMVMVDWLTLRQGSFGSESAAEFKTILSTLCEACVLSWPTSAPCGTKASVAHSVRTTSNTAILKTLNIVPRSDRMVGQLSESESE